MTVDPENLIMDVIKEHWGIKGFILRKRLKAKGLDITNHKLRLLLEKMFQKGIVEKVDWNSNVVRWRIRQN